MKYYFRNNITRKNNGNDRIRTCAQYMQVISSHSPSPLGHVTLTTPTGFEPARPMGIRLAGERVNHSATVSYDILIIYT